MSSSQLATISVVVIIGAYNLMGFLVSKNMPKKVSEVIKKDHRKALWYTLWIMIGALTANAVQLFIHPDFVLGRFTISISILISSLLIWFAGIKNFFYKACWWIIIIAIGIFSIEGIAPLFKIKAEDVTTSFSEELDPNFLFPVETTIASNELKFITEELPKDVEVSFLAPIKRAFIIFFKLVFTKFLCSGEIAKLTSFLLTTLLSPVFIYYGFKIAKKGMALPNMVPPFISGLLLNWLLILLLNVTF